MLAFFVVFVSHPPIYFLYGIFLKGVVVAGEGGRVQGESGDRASRRWVGERGLFVSAMVYIGEVVLLKRMAEKTRISKAKSAPFTKIRKRNGQLAEFRPSKIRSAIGKAAEATGVRDSAALDRLAEKVVALLEERFPKGAVPTVEQVQDVVEEVLLASPFHTMAKAYILYRRERAEERAAKKALVGELVTTPLSLNALRLLKERYLQRKDDGKLETPNDLFLRVAKVAAAQEARFVDEREMRSLQIRFHNLLKRLDFLPNTPALVNAGRLKGSLCSSTGFVIPDSIEGIFETLKNAAVMQRNGSGVGFNFSLLRPARSSAGGIKELAQGPIPHLKTYNMALSKIKQMGVRVGANMGILSVHHPDILDFITAKAQDKSIANFNLSVALTEQFMEAVVLDKEYELIMPHTGRVAGVMNARQVFDILVASAWNFGDPGVLFEDVIEAGGDRFACTSPCAEFLLADFECGIVGAINLANMVEEGKIAWDRLESTAKLGLRLLDALLDASEYPIAKCKKVVMKNRKVGVGVMGFAHLLAQIGVPYDSDQAVELAEKIMERIKRAVDEESVSLGKLKGTCSDGVHRNKTRTAVSPTGSLSMIADCSPGIEPVFSVSYVRYVSGSREYYYLDPYLQSILKKEEVLSDEVIEKIANHGLDIPEVPERIKRIFPTAMQISPEWHIKMQAAFQKFCDNAVSKTVNLPHNATLIDVENAILLAYKLGCKGITVYRQGSRSDEIFKLAEVIQRKRPAKIPRVLDALKNRLENKALDEFS
ncbi:hypothetical protein D6783_00695 [Candidatus Woesearchaeota archaeon]|nr:MAG: hypothetical protein D6783_00695 [Candidatus Woesearchaeota archaeon]